MGGKPDPTGQTVSKGIAQDKKPAATKTPEDRAGVMPPQAQETHTVTPEMVYEDTASLTAPKEDTGKPASTPPTVGPETTTKPLSVEEPGRTVRRSFATTHPEGIRTATQSFATSHPDDGPTVTRSSTTSHPSATSVRPDARDLQSPSWPHHIAVAGLRGAHVAAKVATGVARWAQARYERYQNESRSGAGVSFRLPVNEDTTQTQSRGNETSQTQSRVTEPEVLNMTSSKTSHEYEQPIRELTMILGGNLDEATKNEKIMEFAKNLL